MSQVWLKDARQHENLLRQHLTIFTLKEKKKAPVHSEGFICENSSLLSVSQLLPLLISHGSPKIPQVGLEVLCRSYQ